MKICFTLLSVFVCLISFCSECYHYHTKQYNTIEVINNKTYWVRTTKDPNDITIVSVEHIWIKNITSNETIYKVAEDSNGILFSDSKYYYWLENNPYTVADYGAGKIIAHDNVSETFGTKAFCVDGAWQFIDYNPYTKKTNTTPLKGFPDSPTVIHEFPGRENYLIKDSSSVYVYQQHKKSIKKIEELSASKVQFARVQRDSDYHFLYDDDSMLLVDINYNIDKEVTKDFPALSNFTEGEFIISEYNTYFELAGHIYFYSENNMDLSSGERVNFLTYKDLKWLNNQKELVILNGKIYAFVWDLVWQNNGIDVSKVKDLEALKKTVTGHYTDGLQDYFHLYKDKHNILKPLKKRLPKTLSYYPFIDSYMHASGNFYTNGQLAFQVNAKYKIINRFKHKTSIKNLRLAYAFDDKLLIEDNIITSVANRETLSFIGSVADVVAGCDGEGPNGEYYPTEVNYSYYFKDNNAVYKYYSGDKKLTKLDITPDDISSDNFLDKINFKIITYPNYD